MRSFAIAALVASASAFPALYDYNMDPEPVNKAAVTVTQVTDVYTTVYAEEGAPAPTHTKKHHKASTPAAPVVTVTSTPAAAVYSSVYAPAQAAPVASSPAAPVVAAAAPTDYAGIVVAHHNAHRANHSAPALVWDDALAATALKIANSCNYAHDTSMDGGGYGQNIAAGCPASNVSSVITELFYNNEAPNFASLYGQSTPSNINDETAFDGWGHFTQIVWKGTTSVGCATVHCDGGLANTGGSVSPDFTVCNYKNPGNYLGEFDANVAQPLGQPSIGWNSL